MTEWSADASLAGTEQVDQNDGQRNTEAETTDGRKERESVLVGLARKRDRAAGEQKRAGKPS